MLLEVTPKDPAHEMVPDVESERCDMNEEFVVESQMEL
jgi:hypothetical protein